MTEKIFKFQGDIDIFTAKDKFKEVEEASLNGIEYMIIDFSEVTFLDSTGLGLLISLKQKLNQENKKIKIINSPANIRKVFEITDLLETFEME